MTATAVPLVETETTSCVVCAKNAPRKLGEIWMGEALLGRVVQCEECKLRFMSPRPTQRQRDWLYEREYASGLPGAHGETRFQSVQSDQDQGHVRFAHYLSRLESKRLAAARSGRPRLLDIGAGTGQLMELARDQGWAVHAIEQSEEACRHLARLFGDAAVAGRDLASCGDSAESYDAIVMAHVIEHLPDPLASLRAVRRLLAPGGQLLVATPNEVSIHEQLWLARQRWRRSRVANPYVEIQWRDGIWQRTARREDERGLVEFQILTTEHLYFFTKATLGRLLERAGFENVGWSAGSVAPGNTRIGRLLRSDAVNRAAFLLGLQSELVALTGRGVSEG